MSSFDGALNDAKAEIDARARAKKDISQSRSESEEAIARFREIMQEHAAEVQQWRCVINDQPAWIVARRRSHHLLDGWETSETYLLDNGQFVEADRQSREYPSEYRPSDGSTPSLLARPSGYRSEGQGIPALLARAVVDLMGLDV